MYESVSGSNSHPAVREELIRFTKRLIGSNDQTGGFVTMGNELEQHIGFGTAFLHVTDVVNDDYSVFVQFVQFGHGTGDGPRSAQ